MEFFFLLAIMIITMNTLSLVLTALPNTDVYHIFSLPGFSVTSGLCLWSWIAESLCSYIFLLRHRFLSIRRMLEKGSTDLQVN